MPQTRRRRHVEVILSSPRSPDRAPATIEPAHRRWVEGPPRPDLRHGRDPQDTPQPPEQGVQVPESTTELDAIEANAQAVVRMVGEIRESRRIAAEALASAGLEEHLDDMDSLVAEVGAEQERDRARIDQVRRRQLESPVPDRGTVNIYRTYREYDRRTVFDLLVEDRVEAIDARLDGEVTTDAEAR